MAVLTVRADGGGDYTSLSAAAAAATANTDEIEIEQWDATYDDGGDLDIPAGVPVTVLDSAKHTGAAETGYRIDSNGSGHVFQISNDGVTLDGLEICQEGTSTSDEGVRFTNDGGTLTLRDCLIWADNGGVSDQDGVYTANIDCTVNYVQCMIWGFGRGGIHAQNFSSSVTQTHNVNSCTIWNNGQNEGSGTNGTAEGGGISARAASGSSQINVNVHNSIVTNGPDSDAGATALTETDATSAIDWDVTYSLIEDSSVEGGGTITLGTGSTSGAEITASTSPGAGTWAIVQNATGDGTADLRLVDDADNDAQDNHATATDAGLTIPSNDIVGTGRPANTNFDIGAFEIDAGGVSATVGLVTETDSVFAVTAINPISQAIGQVSETNSAFAVTPNIGSDVSQTVGIVAEADTAFGVGTRLAVGQVSETDTAFGVGTALSVGLVTETSSAFGVTAVNPAGQTVGLVTETNSAFSVSGGTDQIVAIGQATETDSALAVRAINGVGAESTLALLADITGGAVALDAPITESEIAVSVPVADELALLADVTDDDLALLAALTDSDVALEATL